MVSRRYYCHYCHSSFPYSREGRLKHCSGNLHVRLRARHYEQFETARKRYHTLSTKEKCRKFLSNQGCNFGDDCIYSHCSQEELEALRLSAEKEAVVAEYGPLPSQLDATLGLLCPSNSEEANRIIFSLRRARLLKKYSNLLGTSGLEASSNVSKSPGPLPQPSHATTTKVDLSFYEPLPLSLQSYTIDDILAQPLPEWG